MSEPKIVPPQGGSGTAPAKPRMFPLQTDRHSPAGPVQIPWSVAEVAYGEYARQYGRSQSLERLAQRGGFGWGEMDLLHPKWREEVSELARLTIALEELVKLQAHYAVLLNQYDGGARHAFASVDEWLSRLRETGKLPN